MQLLGELPGIEITDSSGLNFCRISLRIIERLLSRFGDEVPDRFAFFLQVALKIGASAAKNINRFHILSSELKFNALAFRPIPFLKRQAGRGSRFFNLTNLPALSSRGKRLFPGSAGFQPATAGC